MKDDLITARNVIKKQIRLIRSLNLQGYKNTLVILRYFVYTKYISAGYEDTDFDRKQLGMWKNAGKIEWRRNQHFTQTMKTGPSRDHTTGKG